jgi:hypothetical protein
MGRAQTAPRTGSNLGLDLASEVPAWTDEALGQTPYSAVKLRKFFEQGKPLPVAD